MKKVCILFVIFSFLGAAFGQEVKERVYYTTNTQTERVAGEDPAKLPPLDQWSAFQIAFGPNFPSNTRNSNVYGLKFGFPVSTGIGRVWGAEVSLFYSGTQHIHGFQSAIFANVAKFIDGVQLGLVNVASVTIDGIQIGLVNYSDENGIQIGLVNVMPKAPLSFCPLLNIYTVSSKRTYIQEAPESRE